MILMTYTSASGDKGRCDAKCYDAVLPGCHCNCGGRNHGIGLAAALENTRRGFQVMAAEYLASHPDGSVSSALNSPAAQPAFEGGLLAE